MSPATFSSRSRLALVALALLVPVSSLAALAGAVAFLRTHGGLARGITAVARQAAYVAGAFERIPGTLPQAQAAALAAPAPSPAAGWVWLAGGDEGDRTFSFAYVEPGKGSTVCFDLDGGSENLERLRDSASEPTLWFKDDGVEYVITDHATVAQARALCAPLQSIGSEMGRVGAKQGRIGAKMGRYGARLGELGGRMGGLGMQLASAGDSQAERERIESDMARVRADMERVREEMRREAGEGSDREELQAQMRELSRRHREALREARAGLRRLLDEARANGKAQRFSGSI